MHPEKGGRSETLSPSLEETAVNEVQNSLILYLVKEDVVVKGTQSWPLIYCMKHLKSGPAHSPQ